MDLKQLEKLYELKQKGIISDSEFLSEKNKILSSDNETNQEHHKKTSSDKSMFDYWLSCMSEKYCCFTGEATRKEWWGFFIFDLLFSLSLGLLVGVLFMGDSIKGDSIIDILGWILWIITFLPWLGLTFRRLNNLKMSGWWAFVLFPFIPILALPFLKGNGKDRTSDAIFLSFFILILYFVIFGGAALLIERYNLNSWGGESENTITQTHTANETQINDKKDTVTETVSILAQQTYNVFADQKSFNQSDDDMDGRYDIGTNIFTNTMDIDLTSPYSGKYSITSFGNADNLPGFVITIPNVPYNDCVYLTQKMNWPGAINSRAYPNWSSETKECTNSTNTVSVFYKK